MTVVARGLAGGDEVAPGEAGGAGDEDARLTAADAGRATPWTAARQFSETTYSAEPWPLEAAAAGSIGLRLGVGRVQAALELAQHRAEQQVAPGRLRERAAGAPQLREVVGGRVHARRARPCRARSRGARRAPPAARAATAGTGSARRRVRVRGAEQRAVGEVHREPDRIGRAARR